MAKGKQGRSRAATRQTAKAKRSTARKRSTAGRTKLGARRSRKQPARTSSAGRRRAAAGAAGPRKATPKPRTVSKKKVAPAKRTATPTKRTATSRASGAKVLSKRPTVPHRLQIDRERRRLEDTVPGPPSSLDLDRHASAARTGRAEMREALSQHTESSPRLTGGDVDANWASAFSTGDEAPGGDMPTPDQDVVEEIGASLGVQYADDEELKAVDKIAERDRHRWELDPASSEDYRDRSEKKNG